MTFEELKEHVEKLVKEHGPSKAKALLLKEISVNTELCLAAARHGQAVVEAMRESKNATLH